MAIFITGASGYIGGSVAKGFADAGYAVRGLVRNADVAAQVAAIGVEPVIGALEDHDLLKTEARNAEGVIHAARAEDLESALALLDALRGSNKPYIQTSGTGLVATEAGGDALAPLVPEDNWQAYGAPERQARRDIDARVIAAAQDAIRTIVICPPAIYGYSKGPRRQTTQVGRLAQYAREHGAATIVGQGINAWSQVHIDDLVDLFLLAYPKAPAGSFYFAESGEASFRDIAEALDKRMRLGGVKSLSMAEAQATIPFARLLGANSRVTGKRARAELGWKPHRAPLLAWIEHEMEL